MEEGLKGADVVMMLRLQRERMAGASIPSFREYFHLYGLDLDKTVPCPEGCNRNASRSDEPRS